MNEDHEANSNGNNLTVGIRLSRYILYIADASGGNIIIIVKPFCEIANDPPK